MRTNLSAYSMYQVFLNNPFDPSYDKLANALHFGVIAAGLLPVCAKDLASPDRLRLEMLVDAIVNCHFSVHDLSKCRGEGTENYSRFNMPIEMGMAMFHALRTQRTEHRCAFFVADQHGHQIFASDLAGLDPIHHENDDDLLLTGVYEWLRSVVKSPLLNLQPTVAVQEKYKAFKSQLVRIKGGSRNGHATHDEIQELMYRMCSGWGWWDWRNSKAGQIEFPTLPLSLIDETHE
jgi:hypothetical protein